MSYFILSMFSAGLMEMPPVSKVMPLPTRPSHGGVGSGRRCGFVAHDDQGRRLNRTLCDRSEGSHLELEDLVNRVNLALQAEL